MVTAIEGSVLVCSHSDPTEDVLATLGITKADLYDSPKGDKYKYAGGRLVHRSPDKRFSQTGNVKDTSLFRVEKLADHPTGLPVYVVEGEKDVLALEAAGAAAVSPAMGTGKAAMFDWTPLRGHTVIIVADKDENPEALKRARKHAVDILHILEPIAVDAVVVETPFGKDAADHIAAGRTLQEFVPIEIPGETYGARRLRITRGSEVKTRRVQWIMPDWIPAGSLTLLAGREGLGKSTIAASICAAITRGMTEGELQGTPRNVLYIHTEDAREFTVAPRLQAAGADMDRVLFVDVQTDTTDDGTLILPLDTLALEKVIAKHDVAFVVLDAATSSMSSELSGKDDRAVRQYLEPLSQLAGRRDCVVFGLCHFGKRDGADTGKLILGSIAWSQVARSVLSVALDDDSGNLVVTNTKGNLAPRTRSMEARIASTTIRTDDGDTEVGAIEWLGESTRDARELLGGSDDSDTDDRTEAEAWLADYLEQHGRPSAKQVKADAAKERIAERTLKRAAKKLGVVYTTEGFPRTSRWSLPAQSGHSETSEVIHGPTGPTGPTEADQQECDGPTGPDSQWGQTPVNGPTGIKGDSVVVNDPPTAPEVHTPGRAPNQWLGSGKQLSGDAA
ncbi:AAA family ATPase [Rhodococcoides fascians]|uniref:AAA family ATPase n=1 Tax=Rhodococcoides fascians TaxID=1828 RepID=UPI00068B1351|nr:AAA family ATPase [Rhodococcus fascians]